MTEVRWTFHHPRMTLAHLGFIPAWLNASSPKSAKSQLGDGYAFGGWQPFSIGKIGEAKDGQFTMSADYILTYPGDPPLMPLASAKLRDETILFYQSSWVAVVEADGSFEVCRMD